MDGDFSTSPELPPLEGLLSREKDIDHDCMLNAAVTEIGNLVKTTLCNGSRSILCVPIVDGNVYGDGVRIEGKNGMILKGRFLGSPQNIENTTVTTLHGSPEVLLSGANIVDGAIEGENVEISLSSGRFSGSVKNGTANGNGVFLRNDNTWYCGEYVNGERSGSGDEHYSSSILYSGQWRDDQYNGRGIMTSPGVVFEGEWADGARVSGILTERVDMDQTFCVSYDAEGVETKRVTKEKAEIEELKAQLLATGGTDAGIATFCKVCMARPVTKVLRPCAHACLCDECEARISNDESTSSARYSRRCYRCPVCRQLTRSSDSIILS